MNQRAVSETEEVCWQSSECDREWRLVDCRSWASETTGTEHSATTATVPVAAPSGWIYVVLISCFLSMHPCTILQKNTTRCTIVLSIFITPLYMFRATMCLSSEEVTESMRHWDLSIFMGGNFYWWLRGHGCPKYVEKCNKYVMHNYEPSSICLQESVILLCKYVDRTFRICMIALCHSTVSSL